MQPTFETSRLLIRPRTLADTEDCVAMDCEPGVTRFVSGPWSDPPAPRAFVEQRTRGPYPEGLGYWTMCRRATSNQRGSQLLGA
jgi:RimJ/RimL family protein N-acetyltransferase